MVDLNHLVELLIICRALRVSPKFPLRAFPLLSLQKPDMIIIKGVGRKISPSLSRGQG
jgi:hypothetical protein